MKRFLLLAILFTILGSFATLNAQQEEYTPQQIEELKSLANSGVVDAQYELAYLYFTGSGVAKNEGLAIELLREAAQSNYPPAQLLYGTCLYEGLGVSKDIALATTWFRKSIEGGVLTNEVYAEKFVLESVADLFCQLGCVYIDGDKDAGIGENSVEALYWLHHASELGSLKADYEIAMIYCFGKGVEKNRPEAFRFALKAAEQGYQLAQCAVGEMYYYGWGVERNIPEAERWYRKAIEGLEVSEYEDSYEDYFYYEGYLYKGMSNSMMSELCARFCYGIGLPQDLEKGRFWYDKLLDIECTTAMLTAIMYGAPRESVINNTSAESHWDRSYIDNGLLKVLCEPDTADAQAVEEPNVAAAQAAEEQKATSSNTPETSTKLRAFKPLEPVLKWFGEYHGIDNTIYAEAVAGYALSGKWAPMTGVNLGLFWEDNYGRLGLHTSFGVMGGFDSWGFRLGPVVRFGDYLDMVEVQLYGGVGPHWDTRDVGLEEFETKCHFSGDVGLRFNFQEYSEFQAFCMSSLSVGCQFMMGEVVPTVGISLWPEVLFDDYFDIDFFDWDLGWDLGWGDNGYTFVCEAMTAFGDGFLAGASVALMPSKIGWYATMLGAINSNGDNFTTGPVWSMLDGALSFYGGFGTVDGDFGMDLGMRLIGNYSLSLGLQTNADTSFVTVGYGFAF